MKQKKMYILFFAFVFAIFNVQGQQSVNTSGGETTSEGGSVSYTIGQVTYKTTKSEGAEEVAEGIQQPYEISVTTGSNVVNISLDIAFFPNPTHGKLILQIDENASGQSHGYTHINVFTAKGKILFQQRIVANTNIINLASLPSSIYLIKVVGDNKKTKTYKIIKH